MYVTGKKGYYLILSGHKYRTSISKEFSEVLNYDIVINNIGRLEVDTGSTSKNPLYLGMSYQDGINSMTDLSYLKDLKDYTDRLHNEFAVYNSKFTLEGDGTNPIVYTPVEDELIYDGGLHSELASSKLPNDIAYKSLSVNIAYINYGYHNVKLYRYNIICVHGKSTNYTQSITRGIEEASVYGITDRVEFTRVTDQIQGMQAIIRVEKIGCIK